ncbi:MAG TPA: site-specific integrase [Arachidicoccus sp.]
MNTTNTFGVDFFLRRDKKDPDRGYLFARITVNGSESEYSLKAKVPFEVWDAKAEALTGAPALVRETNDYVNSVRNRVTNAYRALQERFTSFTALDVKEYFLGKHHSQNSHRSVLSLVKYHKENSKLKPGTMKNYGATRQYLENFIRYKFNREDVPITSVDYAFVMEFETFIPKHPIRENDPCKGNGTAKHIERLKSMIALAKRLRWIKEDPVADFMPHRTKFHRRKLTIEHFILLENNLFEDPQLEFCRHLFLFSCYTGMAYAEVMSLSDEDFDTSASGKVWSKKYRQKSDGLEPVPLIDKAVAIINMYKNREDSTNRGRIFPYISNCDYNRNLKIIAGILLIPILLQTHHARHFFAREVALKSGVPIETVQKLMGHLKLSTTQIYADADEEKIEMDTEDLEARFELRKQAHLKGRSLIH